MEYEKILSESKRKQGLSINNIDDEEILRNSGFCRSAEMDFHCLDITRAAKHIISHANGELSLRWVLHILFYYWEMFQSNQ